MDRDARSRHAILRHTVRSLTVGSAHALEDGCLTVDLASASACFRSPQLEKVEVRLASPGEAVRIVKLLDCVEPRACQVGNSPGTFPGFLTSVGRSSPGPVHVLEGACVTVAGFLPRAQEAVLDLSGPAAELTPFSRLRHVVIVPHPVADPDWTEVERALRAGALRLAAQLAQAAVSEPADEVVDLEPRSSRHRPSGLPVVGVIINLQTQGAFKDVFVYGNSYSAGLPTLIDPYEMDLGAVVSGQYGHPGLKNPTYVHQNNPVVRTMRERDGVDLNFGGVIISPEPVELPRKELVAAHAGRLAELAGWDGAVVTKEGGGNADLDMALKMDELERRGMAGVGIFAEMSGTDGAGPPLVSPPKVASAMVSAGNYDQRIQLPAMCRAIGGEVLALTSQPVTAAHEVAVAAIYGSLSPVGAGHIQAVAR